MALPAEPITLHGYDFTAQLRKNWQLIEQAEPVPQKHTALESYLCGRVSGERGEAWIDQLELNVASRACEVFGLLLAQGPDGKPRGHGEAVSIEPTFTGGDYAQAADEDRISGSCCAVSVAIYSDGCRPGMCPAKHESDQPRCMILFQSISNPASCNSLPSACFHAPPPSSGT